MQLFIKKLTSLLKDVAALLLWAGLSALSLSFAFIAVRIPFVLEALFS